MMHEKGLAQSRVQFTVVSIVNATREHVDGDNHHHNVQNDITVKLSENYNRQEKKD